MEICHQQPMSRLQATRPPRLSLGAGVRRSPRPGRARARRHGTRGRTEWGTTATGRLLRSPPRDGCCGRRRGKQAGRAEGGKLGCDGREACCHPQSPESGKHGCRGVMACHGGLRIHPDGVGEQVFEADELEGLGVGGLEHHPRRHAGVEASFQRAAQRHHWSPGLRPGNPYSGRGGQSLPRLAEYREAAVTRRRPCARGRRLVRQPSRNQPVMGWGCRR